MTIEEMNEIRRETGVTYQQICFDSGVPMSTVAKVLSGATKNPRIGTMRALETVLARYKMEHEWKKASAAGERASNEAEQDAGVLYDGAAGHAARLPAGVSDGSNAATSGKGLSVWNKKEETGFNAHLANESGSGAESAGYSSVYAGSLPERTAGCLRETPYVYGSEASKGLRRFTTADRDALPEERRTELIDGVLYDMASPSVVHQDLILQIARQFEDCMDAHPSDCHLFISPADVMLDRDIYTAVVPDLFIICDREQLTVKNIQGAPAFILEVLSPSSRMRDFTVKLEKYKSSGVKEYWIVDPIKKSVTVFNLMLLRGETEEGSEIEKYTFDDSVPVIISNGSCSIDMKKAAAHLDRVFGEAWRTAK